MTANDRQLRDETCEVAIIGAGPSGLAAASVLREHGVNVTIIDEQARAGGQILRQPPKNFSVAHWLPSKLYDGVKAALHAVSEREDIDWRFQSTVLGIMRPSPYRTQRADASGCPHELWIQSPSGCYLLRARAVLLAPGCYERPLAFPGWTLPGVMGAGAIQGFVKSQQFVPGNRFVLAGSHPLQLVVADQLLSAGAQVAAVVFTQRRQDVWRVLRHPIVALRNRRQLLETFRILHRLRRAGVPVIFGHTIVRADGTTAVESATLAAIDSSGTIDHSRTQVFECDRIGICHGFLASSELARQAGADMHWKDQAGGWLARHDEWFESSVKNLFVAGEITSVDGADAALEKGRIGAVGILRALGRVDDNRAHSLASNAWKRLSPLQSFAAVLQQLAQPPAKLALLTMSDESILCRCESIRRGELQRALAENKHVLSADAAKLLTRVGMGLCQGRLCGDNVARLIAEMRNVRPDEVGTFQVQAPVKPVPLSALVRERCG
jgi:NADPH-dependent 2,4-dienoyl-CoA reductase/sulfur reductase-like enzyme